MTDTTITALEHTPAEYDVWRKALSEDDASFVSIASSDDFCYPEYAHRANEYATKLMLLAGGIS